VHLFLFVSCPLLSHNLRLSLFKNQLVGLPQ
jgi:hypothetical protein